MRLWIGSFVVFVLIIAVILFLDHRPWPRCSKQQKEK